MSYKIKTLSKKYLIFGVLLLVIASAGCTGGSEPIATNAPKEPVTTPPPTTPPVIETVAPAEEVDYTILSFYDAVDDVYRDGKVSLDYVFYGNTQNGEIKIQHEDIEKKEGTLLGEPKYALEFEGVINGNPLKKTWMLTEPEIFSPRQELEVRKKP